MDKLRFFAVLLVLLASVTQRAASQSTGCNCTAQGTATYKFLFTANWSIPSPPSSAHWSWPVGAAHDACTVVWRNNTLASPGVQSVAETGSTGTIQAEFNAAKVLSQFRGSLIFPGTGSTSASFTTNRYYPLVSALTMIAPSPDWFVGVDSLNLCDGASWKPAVTVPMYAWDAGTDSGLDYGSPNQPTTPHQVIAPLDQSPRSTPFQTGQPQVSLGSFTFTLSSVDSKTSGTDPGCAKCPAKVTTAATTTPAPTESATTTPATTTPAKTEPATTTPVTTAPVTTQHVTTAAATTQPVTTAATTTAALPPTTTPGVTYSVGGGCPVPQGGFGICPSNCGPGRNCTLPKLCCAQACGGQDCVNPCAVLQCSKSCSSYASDGAGCPTCTCAPPTTQPTTQPITAPTYTIGGGCPVVQGGFGICPVTCTANSNCTSEQLCCLSRCGSRICTSPCPNVTCATQCSKYTADKNGCPTCACVAATTPAATTQPTTTPAATTQPTTTPAATTQPTTTPAAATTTVAPPPTTTPGVTYSVGGGCPVPQGGLGICPSNCGPGRNCTLPKLCCAQACGGQDCVNPCAVLQCSKSCSSYASDGAGCPTCTCAPPTTQPTTQPTTAPTYTIGGGCPVVQGGFGICPVTCTANSNCTSEQLCCLSSCGGRTCTSPCPIVTCATQCSKYTADKNGCPTCACVVANTSAATTQPTTTAAATTTAASPPTTTPGVTYSVGGGCPVPQGGFGICPSNCGPGRNCTLPKLCCAQACGGQDCVNPCAVLQCPKSCSSYASDGAGCPTCTCAPPTTQPTTQPTTAPTYTIGGGCPVVQGGFGSCPVTCTANSNCTSEQLCCLSSCGGRTCTSPCPIVTCATQCSKYTADKNGCPTCACVVANTSAATTQPTTTAAATTTAASPPTTTPGVTYSVGGGCPVPQGGFGICPSNCGPGRNCTLPKLCCAQACGGQDCVNPCAVLQCPKSCSSYASDGAGCPTCTCAPPTTQPTTQPTTAPTYTIGGGCPVVQGGFGSCPVTCTANSNCTSEQLCCLSSCGGRTCTSPCPIVTCATQCSKYTADKNGCPTCACVVANTSAATTQLTTTAAATTTAASPPTTTPGVTYSVGGGCPVPQGGFGICPSNCGPGRNCTLPKLCCAQACGGQDCVNPCAVLQCPKSCSSYASDGAGCPTCTCAPPTTQPTTQPTTAPMYAIGGGCPVVQGGFGICPVTCTANSNCTSEQLCCLSSCGGRTCTSPCPNVTCATQCSKYTADKNGCPTCACVAATTPAATTQPTTTPAATTQPATTAAAATTTAASPPTTTPGCSCTAPGTASYAFMFNADWHIPSPPVGAHWSWPVGAAHDACTVVWRNNTLASPGVQSVAETGSTGTIQAEFNAAKVLSQFRGSLIGATSSTSSSFTANRYYPLVSALTMIAPSPDWFVGVDSLNLCDGASWKSKVTVPMYAWDAGTDSGLNYGSPNQPTIPHQVIAPLDQSPRSTPFQTGQPQVSLGSFVFTLSSVDLKNNGTDPGCAKCPAKVTTAAPTTTPTTQATTTPPTTQATTAAPTTAAPTYTIGGGCPAVQGGFGICPAICTANSNCSKGDLCCPNACGSRVCTGHCPVLTCTTQCSKYTADKNGCPTCACVAVTTKPTTQPNATTTSTTRTSTTTAAATTTGAVTTAAPTTMTYSIGGACPVLQGGFGSCPVGCAADSNCTSGQLCCPNACGGRVCSSPCPVLTCATQCSKYTADKNGCPTCACVAVTTKPTTQPPATTTSTTQTSTTTAAATTTGAVTTAAPTTMTYSIGGACPVLQGGFGSCPVGCAADSNCTSGQLCCPNACGGRVCSSPCPVLTCTTQCSKYTSDKNGCPTCTCVAVTTKPTTKEAPTTLPTTQSTTLTTRPTVQPTTTAAGATTMPVTQATTMPVTQPTTMPVTQTTTMPVTQTTTMPVTQPTTMPVTQPTTMPVTQPTTMPVTQPTTMPVTQPTTMPVTQPTTMPVTQPTTMPVTQPTTMPVTQTTTMPVTQPTTETATATTRSTTKPATERTLLPTEPQATTTAATEPRPTTPVETQGRDVMVILTFTLPANAAQQVQSDSEPFEEYVRSQLRSKYDLTASQLGEIKVFTPGQSTVRAEVTIQATSSTDRQPATVADQILSQVSAGSFTLSPFKVAGSSYQVSATKASSQVTTHEYEEEESDSNAGAIAGGVIGGLAALVLIILLVVYLKRGDRNDRVGLRKKSIPLRQQSDSSGVGQLSFMSPITNDYEAGNHTDEIAAEL